MKMREIHTKLEGRWLTALWFPQEELILVWEPVDFLLDIISNYDQRWRVKPLWWCVPVIPSQRQDHQEFKASLGYLNNWRPSWTTRPSVPETQVPIKMRNEGVGDFSQGSLSTVTSGRCPLLPVKARLSAFHGVTCALWDLCFLLIAEHSFFYPCVSGRGV